MMQEKYIVSNLGRTYYWTWKKDSPFTLVFLHGLTANHHLFDTQYDVFSEKYDVIAWDAPAHGKSRPYKNFTYANAAEELKVILDNEGVRKAVLVGQSGGGFAAQSFYKKYPGMVIGMVMIGSTPFDPYYYSRSDLWWLRQMDWMPKLYPDRILRTSMAKMCAKTKRAEENMMEMLECYSRDELCRLMYLGFAGFIPEIQEMEIKCPVWLTVGEFDRTGKVMHYNKEWHEKEGYPLHIIKGAAHNANDDMPDAFNELLEGFLDTL